MRQKDLINRIGGQIEGFTVLDVEAENPFGWDLNTDHVRETKQKPQKRSRSYDPLKDSRISDLFRPCGEPPKLRRYLMGKISLCIVAGLCAYDLNEPDDEKLAGLLAAAGTTAKEMNLFAGTLSEGTLSCFYRSSLIPVGILLYKALWDALCEGCGVAGWSADEKGVKKTHAGREETAAHGRLQAVAEYLRKESLLVFSGAGAEDKDRQKREALAAYEDFFVRYTASNCRRKIAVWELQDVRNRSEKERVRLLQHNRKIMTRELRHKRQRYAVRTLSPSQMAAMVNSVPEKAVNGNAPAKIGSRPETEDFFSAGIAEKLWQFVDGKNVEEAAHLLAVECAIHPLPAALQANMSRVERNLIALDAYVDAVQDKSMQTVNEAAVREAEAMCAEDGLAAAEGAFLAILDGDEVSRLTICRFVFPVLGQLFSVPDFGCETPEPEDWEEWDGDIYPGDNEGLVLPVIRDDEVYTCKPKKSGPGEGVLYPVKLNAMIGQYAGCRFDEEIYVRKSLIKAFSELGISQRKARECAIVEAVVETLLDREEFASKNYFSESRPETGKNTAGETAADFERVSARLEEAVRAKKSGDRENQRLRHEVAELNRRLDRFQAEIDKRDELIGLYERMDEEEEAGENGTQGENAASGENGVEFPFYTDLKVVLYGGFHSFHQDIEKRLPGIRIVPYAAHLDLAPFRNADVIFIQINKTSHSNYWNVCDTARTMGIPFYHLNYANPGRCAAEMAKKIREIEKSGK